MEIVKIVCASALRIMLFMLIAVILGSFLPVILVVLLSCIIEPLTFYRATMSGFFVVSITLGIVIALFWVGNKVENFNLNKNNKIK